METPTTRKAALSLILRSDLMQLSTLDEHGYPETRELFNLRKLRNDCGTFGPDTPGGVFMNLLGTNTSSRKVAQMRKDPRSCLYYVDPVNFEGLTVVGRAEEVFDREVRDALWLAQWEIYYPGGKDGGDFSIFRFMPERARYYHGLATVEIPCDGPA